jgi:hypothetical protein
MMNFVFWDLKPQIVPHRRHIKLPYRDQPVNDINDFRLSRR